MSIVAPQPIPESASHLNFVVSTRFNVNSNVVLGVAYAGGTTNPATPADDLGSNRPTTVTILAGERRATLRVPIVNDDIVDENETFTVALSLPAENPPGHILHFDGGADTTTATGTIEDDDEAPVVNVDDESVVENVTSGNATFTAELTAAVNSPVVLAVEVTAGTATLGVDVGADLPTTVTIDQGQTSATFTVPITDDNYTVNLSAAADEAVVVRWTATDGTAIVANDLQATTNTVTFAANTSTAQTFTTSPTNDNKDEDNETFTVTLGPDTDGNNPLPTGVTISTNNSSTATITDDDEAPPGDDALVRIGDVTVGEGAGPARFAVTLSRAVDSAVVLDVMYADGSAAVGTDLGAPVLSTVTIAAATTRATLAVPIVDDDRDAARRGGDRDDRERRCGGGLGGAGGGGDGRLRGAARPGGGGGGGGDGALDGGGDREPAGDGDRGGV